MEILEIKSQNDRTRRSPETRAAGAHTYHLNCRQFTTVRRDWQNDGERASLDLAVMTLSFERIWMTAGESEQVAAAIKATQRSITLDDGAAPADAGKRKGF